MVLLTAVRRNGAQLTRDRVASAISRPREFVDERARQYYKHGPRGVTPKPSGRRQTQLTLQKRQQLSKILDTGPTPESERSVFFGRDIRQIIQEHFGVVYHLNGVYALLHRRCYSHLVHRPKHPKGDPKSR